MTLPGFSSLPVQQAQMAVLCASPPSAVQWFAQVSWVVDMQQSSNARGGHRAKHFNILLNNLKPLLGSAVCQALEWQAGSNCEMSLSHMAGKDLNVSFLFRLDPNSSWHMFIRGYIFHLVHEIFIICESQVLYSSTEMFSSSSSTLCAQALLNAKK